jgi:hypothetical protein
MEAEPAGMVAASVRGKFRRVNFLKSAIWKMGTGSWKPGMRGSDQAVFSTSNPNPEVIREFRERTRISRRT